MCPKTFQIPGKWVDSHLNSNTDPKLTHALYHIIPIALWDAVIDCGSG